MKRFIAWLLLLVMLMMALVGCGKKDDGTPEGFEAASSLAGDGFVLYVPEGWSYYRSGGLVSAYVSSLDRSGVTATFVVSALGAEAYFAAAASSFSELFDSYTFSRGETVTVAGKPAYTAYYQLTYDGASYGCEQTVIEAGDGVLCVLTAQASLTVREGSETSPYADRMTDFADIRSYFVLGAPPAFEEPTFEGDAPQGMKIASNKTVLGCLLCVPEDWHVAVSGGQVSASAADGTNVQLTEVYPTTGSVVDYFAQLREEYERMYEDFVLLSAPTEENPESVELGGGKAYLFSFTLTHEGVTYRVDQYVCVRGGGFRSSIYLLTFTARESLWSTHESEFARIKEVFSHK